MNLFPTLLALASVAASGQTSPAASTPKDVTLLEGRGELLTFDNDIHKVVIAEPKIADAVVVSPREVMVNARGPGKTSLVVWEKDRFPQAFHINVTKDLTAETIFRHDLESELTKGLPGANVQFTGNSETIVLTGSVKDPDQSARAAAFASTRTKKVVNLLDVPPPAEPRQIMLQVKFASIDRVGLTELGANLFSRNDTLLGATGTQQFQAPRFSQLQFQDQQFSNSTVNIADILNIFLYRPDLNIGATIRALQSRNLLQILAEPNLITVEGKEANFVAGGEFPFPVLTATTTGGAVAPVITVQFKPFGVQLGFTPYLTPTGAIRLKVRPEVSSLDYSNAANVQGVLIPALSTRRAETEVILKDGESFAIAGLIDNRVIKTVSQIWGLGNIPILGEIFKSRSTRKSTDELLVVITPRFVQPLTADQKAKLPETIESYLPTVGQEREAKEALEREKKEKKNNKKKPEVVGPSGYQTPKP